MKQNRPEVPRYKLQNFRSAHRHPGDPSTFGHNQPDPEKAVAGFQLYSSDGLLPVTGPLKSEFYRLSITVTGSLDMQIGLDHYQHRPRTLAFTFPHQIFSKHHASDDASGYYLLFDADFLNDLVPAIRIGEEFPFYDLFGTPVFQVSGGELSRMLSLVMDIDHEVQHPSTGRDKAIRLYLYLLLLEAKRSYERQQLGGADGRLPESHKLTRRFRKLVARHYLTERQVGDYARLLGVSANHLNKTVKQHTGQTASGAIREMLLQDAKLRLLYSDDSVAEIAYQLDFSDPASFNRFFRSLAGETPLVFRSRNK
jgi:AraC-like DNA-binding protein